MRIPQNHIQRSKAGAHTAQAISVFITGCLALAVLTKNGGTGGAVLFMFGLCFLTIPALIYQIMVPMWTRAWRFANVYAYATIDIICAILWFAAFIAVSTWNAAGIREGESDDKNNTNGAGTCAVFGYGSESKCETSKASVGFGVIIWLLFCLTSAISIHGVMQYRRTGIMPNGNSKRHGQAEQLGTAEDAHKDPWSTNTDELEPDHPSPDPFSDASATDERRLYGQISQDDPDNHSLHDTATQDGFHPGRPASLGSQLEVAPPAYDPTLAPSALSPGVFVQSPGGRVDFPEGHYEEAFR